MNKFLIVGLGNIGAEYEHTRHNIGFDILDAFVATHKSSFSVERLAFKAEVAIKGKKIICIKPTTYMNLSGKAVKYWSKELKIEKEQVLILTDDIALPFETLRLKPKGSAGGHNGLKSVEESLETQEYARLRMGVGSEFSKGRQVDYVLGKFSTNEFEVIPFILDKTSIFIENFCLEGIQKTMNKYNQ
jgi:PTH1 family peptidyl-tRNA hydrolase